MKGTELPNPPPSSACDGMTQATPPRVMQQEPGSASLPCTTVAVRRRAGAKKDSMRFCAVPLWITAGSFMSYNRMHCWEEGLALQCLSLSDELMNYIIIITMFYTISCRYESISAPSNCTEKCCVSNEKVIWTSWQVNTSDIGCNEMELSALISARHLKRLDNHSQYSVE